MKVGVYVGSFNPPHNGHIKIMNHLLNKYLDKIIVIPTQEYWNKNNLLHIEHRINVLKLIKNEKIIVNETLNNLEFTYQILNELSKNYNNLYLIIGADNLEKFHLWKNINEILNHNVIVLNRNNIDSMKYINNFERKEKFILINDLEEINISSTFIRENLNNKDITQFINKEILEYIKNNNLYEV